MANGGDVVDPVTAARVMTLTPFGSDDAGWASFNFWITPRRSNSENDGPSAPNWAR